MHGQQNIKIYKRVKVWKTFDAEFLKEIKLKVL